MRHFVSAFIWMCIGAVVGCVVYKTRLTPPEAAPAFACPPVAIAKDYQKHDPPKLESGGQVFPDPVDPYFRKIGAMNNAQQVPLFFLARDWYGGNLLIDVQNGNVMGGVEIDIWTGSIMVHCLRECLLGIK